MNVSRRPYSFGRGSGRGHVAGPRSWKYYDGLAGYAATLIWPILKGLEELGVTADSLETPSGLREALSGPHESEVRASLRHAQGALGVGPVDERSILESMVAAEHAGRVGRIAFGSRLTALDCAFGDLKVEKFKAAGLATTPAINFNLDVDFQWEPVDSQRLLLWARGQGKQEAVARCLFRLHFEEQQSLSCRRSLLAAASSAGIDAAECAEFLDGDLLRADVLQGYDQHMRCGIRWPPFIVLNGPGSNGGPFRDGSRSCMVVRGSAEAFAEAFERLWSASHAWISIPPTLDDEGAILPPDTRAWKQRHQGRDAKLHRWPRRRRDGWRGG